MSDSDAPNFVLESTRSKMKIDTDENPLKSYMHSLVIEARNFAPIQLKRAHSAYMKSRTS